MAGFRRELAYRENDGLRVRLLWRPHDDAVIVAVDDRRGGGDLEARVDPESALDAFRHPYAYAADLASVPLVDACVGCGASPAIDEHALCGHCHWKLVEEIAGGLDELHAYIARHG